MPVRLPQLRVGGAGAAWAMVALAALAGARGADSPGSPPGQPGAAPRAQVAPSAGAGAAGSKCASVVIRNCRARLVSESEGAGQQEGKSGDVTTRWEAVRASDADSDEILIEEQRIRDEAVREVFERYMHPTAAGLVTRSAANGARCTTIVSTGATLCSQGGSQTPGMSLPHADFSDAVF